MKQAWNSIVTARVSKEKNKMAHLNILFVIYVVGENNLVNLSCQSSVSQSNKDPKEAIF